MASHPVKTKLDLYALTTQLSRTPGLPEPLYQNSSFYQTWAKGMAPRNGIMATQEEVHKVMQGAAQLGRYNTLSGNRVAPWQLGIDAFPATPTFP
jgi:hypothetical protein